MYEKCQQDTVNITFIADIWERGAIHVSGPLGYDSRVLGRILKVGAWKCRCKILGHSIFQGRPQCTQITTINMYLLIEIAHYFLYKLSWEIIMGFKEFYYYVWKGTGQSGLVSGHYFDNLTPLKYLIRTLPPPPPPPPPKPLSANNFWKSWNIWRRIKGCILINISFKYFLKKSVLVKKRI